MAALNPYTLAGAMNVLVLSPEDIARLSPTDLHHLLVADPRSWSAGSIRLHNGRVVVVLNPTHAETRTRATLMEELAHIHLGHKPSQLIVLEGLTSVRSFNKSQETAAYWVGAAALIPRIVLRRAQEDGVDRSTLAQDYGVSTALVAFREKVTGSRLDH
jgi:Zn-dependent peptidase ImmA (M78 family)